MLPKFLKIFPHEYKRVLGIARKKPDSEKAAPHAAGMAIIGANKQVMHG
jgi:preprotein translocase subunit Sss1